MALIVVTGPLGAGKSYYGVRKAVESLERGKMVITNFRMTPEWQDKVVDRHWFRWLIPGRRRELKSLWRSRSLVVKDLKELMKVRVEGKGEGRCVVIIDEAHLFMNARSWNDEDRMDLVQWASLSRKLGFDVYLITQDLKSLDRQVRDRLTYQVDLANLKQFKVMGLRIVPFNFFLAIWHYHGSGTNIVKREMYRLNYQAKLYDTMDVGAFGLIEPADVIKLPLRLPAPLPEPVVVAAASSAVGAVAPPHDPLEAARRRLIALGVDMSGSSNSHPGLKSETKAVRPAGDS